MMSGADMGVATTSTSINIINIIDTGIDAAASRAGSPPRYRLALQDHLVKIDLTCGGRRLPEGR
jgi:hypothetical protein